MAVAGGIGVLGVVLDPWWRRLAAGLPVGRWSGAPVDPPVVLGLAVGTLAAVLAVTAGPALALLAPVAVLASAIDVRLHRVPDRLTGPSAVVLAAVAAAAAAVTGDAAIVVGALAGAALLAGVLLLIHLASPSGLGFGDVKLAVPLGLAVGSTGVLHVVSALVLATVIGAGAAVLVLARHRDRSRAFAFGPCLCAGAVLALVR